MAEFYMKFKDKLPVLRSELTDDSGYIDLSTAQTVNFIYQLKSRLTGPTTGTASIIATGTALVEYAWPTGTVISGGSYYGEWRVAFTGGKEISIPNDSYIMFFLQNRLS